MYENFFLEPLNNYPISLGYHDCVLNFPSHYHPAFEAIFVFDGSTRLITDTGTFDLSAGDIALVSSLVIHGYSSTEKSETCTVLFENKAFSDVENFIPVNSKQQVIVLKNIDSYLYDIILNQLNEAAYYQGTKDTPLCVNHSKILLIHLLREAVKQLNSNEATALGGDARINQTHRILMFIQEHYKEKISLDIISQNLHIDKFEVSRIINNNLGTSISDLVNKYRLLDVCCLLENTRLSMPIIANQTGFTSESAMYRNFHKVFNISPIKYRKEKRS